MRRKVLIAPGVDQTITETLPENPSGEHELPSQQEFYEQAIPLILETYAEYYGELTSIFPNRQDHKFAVFTNLVGIDLIETTAHLVYAFNGTDDYIVLAKIVITPKLETHATEEPKQ